MKPLTRRQNDALVFIKYFISENEFSPSIRDIAVGLDLSSSSTVFSLLQQLVDKGFITHVAGQPRSIVIVEQSNKLTEAEMEQLLDYAYLWLENQKFKHDQWLSIYYLKEFRSRIPKDSGIYNELNKRIKNSELLAKACKS